MFVHQLRGLVLLVVLASVAPAAAQELAYPEARRVDQVDHYHGVAVADPYRWMEDLESDELHAWMQAQDALRARYLAGSTLAGELAERIAAVSSYGGYSAPLLRGRRRFFTAREAGRRYGRLQVQEGNPAASRTLLDLEALNAGSQSGYVSSYSLDGRFVTYNTAENQSRWMTLHVVRVADGTVLPDALTGIYGGRSNAAWTPDGRGFYYARYEVPDDPQAPLGKPVIYYHAIGTAQREDRRIYEHPDNPALSFALRVTHDGRYLVLSASESGGTFNGLSDRLFYKDLRAASSPVVALLEAVKAPAAFEASDGDRFWIRTTHEAPNMRLVAVDLARPSPAHWQDVIAEADEPIQAVSEIGGRFVVQYLKDARIVLRVFDREGRLRHEVDQLAPSLTGLADDPENEVAYYGISLLHDPGVIYRLNVRTGDYTVHFRPDLQHDPDAFELTQVFFESTDGTRVPMFLLHRKDMARDGTNPVFMYGYGAWSWSAYPWQAHMLPWVERGGIYAVPNIRGGGEYGEPWHLAGVRHRKQHGIDDFIAAAEWLIDNGYTSASLLAANGGSASGVLPAAGMVQRPDLFGAAVINFPTLDQLRYEFFGSAKSWVPEFGSVEDPEDFAALHAYSPYHNLEPGTCYPPTWIQVGENDDTTTPMHGYKFAAALQAAQGCGHPVLLKITWGAGHSYGLTPEQRYRTQAEELAFLIKTLNLPAAASQTGAAGER